MCFHPRLPPPSLRPPIELKARSSRLDHKFCAAQNADRAERGRARASLICGRKRENNSPHRDKERSSKKDRTHGACVRAWARARVCLSPTVPLVKLYAYCIKVINPTGLQCRYIKVPPPKTITARQNCRRSLAVVSDAQSCSFRW